jgi:hypothetical protein
MTFALALALGGCGVSSGSSSHPGSRTTTRISGNKAVLVGARGAVTVSEGQAVPLGLTPAAVERRLGAPAVSLRRKDAHFDCMFYDIVGQPRRVQIQYCFRGGRLKLLASYIRG